MASNDKTANRAGAQYALDLFPDQLRLQLLDQPLIKSFISSAAPDLLTPGPDNSRLLAAIDSYLFKDRPLQDRALQRKLPEELWSVLHELKRRMRREDLLSITRRSLEQKAEMGKWITKLAQEE